uniref:Uncharacterized protein n=1 Tax=viral metagenome TaxID=1070528 RepID=A0A6C0HCG4_9ZZZZ
MNLITKTIVNIILLVISVFMFMGIIKWGNYLIKTKTCECKQNRSVNRTFKEGFDMYAQPTLDLGMPDTSHTVNLPINTTFSCENMCGPLARCSKTGEQCTSDVDCYGCQPKVYEPAYTKKDIGGQNDAGKLTSGITPRYSVLTTDIGTQAKLYGKGENLTPPQYFKGVDQWRKSFDAGMELYNKKFNPNIQVLPFLPKYPPRPSLSGEFVDDGPLAANAFLSNK